MSNGRDRTSDDRPTFLSPAYVTVARKKVNHSQEIVKVYLRFTITDFVVDALQKIVVNQVVYLGTGCIIGYSRLDFHCKKGMYSRQNVSEKFLCVFRELLLIELLREALFQHCCVHDNVFSSA